MTGGWLSRLSLRTRMALLMIAIVALLGFTVRVLAEQRLADDMQRDLETRATNLAANLAAETVDPILYQDFVALERVLSQAQHTWEDFEYAFVLDPMRNVLAHTLIGDFPEELRRINRYRAVDGPQVQRIQALGGYHRDIAVPIYAGQLGVLHLGVQDGSISRRVNALRQDIVILLGFVALVGGLLAFLLTWKGLQPLESIAATLDSFRPGRVRHEIPVHGNDELAHIAGQINAITLRLHQAQIVLDGENRLATLGRFASVIAHEVGNPLASIMTRLELMERSSEERFLHDSLPIVRGQLGRIQKFLRGLSGISRGGHTETPPCDLNDVVREVIDVLRYDPRATAAQLRSDFDDLQPVCCVRDQIYQVVLNLGINGLRAAGAAGTVVFSTRVLDDAAVIEVADDGPGVADEIKDRVFDPFFSTAPGGTGLGLTISRDLVRKHGGELSLVSHQGRGARFQIRLPHFKTHGRANAEQEDL